MPERQAFLRAPERPASGNISREIEIFFFDAGGGHRSAANALIDSIQTQYPGWNVKLVNLQSLLQSTDPLYNVTGINSEQVYNAAIRRGWTRGSRPFLRTLQGGIKLNAPFMRTILRNHWKDSTPDLVVSVIPNFNRVMFDALHSVHAHTPYLTIMTDLADSPPHFWMEDQNQYIICGSHKAVLQAHMSGFYSSERIFETSGMILRPSFYQTSTDPDITHEKLGLNPNKPVAIIMFGGNGSKISADIAEKLHSMDVQSIVMCGKNVELLEELKGRPGCHAVGYTDKVAAYMRLANFFIGKPGPGSMSEALHMGLPLIVENNAGTMIQERYNIVWAEEQKLGISVPSFDKIDLAVRFLLNEQRIKEYRANALRLRNTAVFEIPPLLDKIITEHPPVTLATKQTVRRAFRKAIGTKRLGFSKSLTHTAHCA